MIASQYGYTFEEFGRMTSREVYISLKNISFRVRDKLHFEAKIHGLDLKGAESAEKVTFDKERDDALTKQMERINRERFGG